MQETRGHKIPPSTPRTVAALPILIAAPHEEFALDVNCSTVLAPSSHSNHMHGSVLSTLTRVLCVKETL